MRYTIDNRDEYLHAVVYGRDTAQQMREFLLAVHAACKQHELPRVLIVVRRSRAVFKPEDYGLAGDTRADTRGVRGYANELLSPACQIAVVGDTHETNAANEYIEMVARQQGVNVRAFRDERAALRWLNGGGTPNRRYRFTRIVISGAPDSAGVYALWDGEDLVYYGRAEGGATIRSRLLDQYYADRGRATHYSWEVCSNPAVREAELLGEYESKFGKLPRDNKVA